MPTNALPYIGTVSGTLSRIGGSPFVPSALADYSCPAATINPSSEPPSPGSQIQVLTFWINPWVVLGGSSLRGKGTTQTIHTNGVCTFSVSAWSTRVTATGINYAGNWVLTGATGIYTPYIGSSGMFSGATTSGLSIPLYWPATMTFQHNYSGFLTTTNNNMPTN